ncbi:hypothetical protein BDW71DRAFT_142393 [Aspergillus fruticulosus]
MIYAYTFTHPWIYYFSIPHVLFPDRWFSCLTGHTINSFCRIPLNPLDLPWTCRWPCHGILPTDCPGLPKDNALANPGSIHGPKPELIIICCTYYLLGGYLALHLHFCFTWA